MQNFNRNGKKGKNEKRKGSQDVTKALVSNSYKKLNLDLNTLNKITVKPKKIKDGKILFDRKNEDHRYIVED